MKKGILSVLAALMCVGALASCGQDIAKEAAEKGKSYFDSGEYETAARAFGVAIDNGSKDEETSLLYSICLSYYQADKEYKAGNLENAKKAIDGINAEYENYGIKEAIATLRNDVERAITAKAQLADAAAKLASGDYAGAGAVASGIDIAGLNEDEVSSLNGLKASVAEAEAAAQAAAEAAKKAEVEKAEAAKKAAQKSENKTQTVQSQPASTAAAINVNVASDAYIYPTDSQLLTVEQLKTLSAADIALIRNEIYARHGQIFTSSRYANYFAGKTWYTPVTDDVRWGELNETERKNIMIIKQYESGM